MDYILNDEGLEAFNEVCHAAAKKYLTGIWTNSRQPYCTQTPTPPAKCAGLRNRWSFFEYAPGVRDTNNLGAWWLENKMDCSLPYEIDEFFDYAGYGESIVENNDGEFVEGLGFVCMEEGYTLEDVLQDTDQGMGGI